MRKWGSKEGHGLQKKIKSSCPSSTHMASHAGVPFRSSQVISYSQASLLIMLGELTSSTPHNHLLYSLFVGLLFSCIERLKTFMSGLLRCGKSCRLRWMNYLRPDLKRGVLTEAEENLVLELHSTLGNRYASYSGIQISYDLLCSSNLNIDCTDLINFTEALYNNIRL